MKALFSSRISTIRAVCIVGLVASAVMGATVFVMSLYALLLPLAAMVAVIIFLATAREQVVNADKDLWELMRWAGEQQDGFTVLDAFVAKGRDRKCLDAVITQAVQRQWIEIDTERPGTLPVYRVQK